MPDTTNLLGALVEAFTALVKTERGTEARLALEKVTGLPNGVSSHSLAEAIVRQAREGMPTWEHLANLQSDNRHIAAENARLRAELETAKREGAREALTRAAEDVGMRNRWIDYGDEGFHGCLAHPQQLRKFRDREYPAPAVADTPKCKCGHDRGDHYTDGHGPASCVGDQVRCPCNAFESAVADTGERELHLSLEVDGTMSDEWKQSGVHRITITPELARRIVAMGGGK